MALYERNSIHYSEVDKDDIVYVSYPCPEDGEYDYLKLSNIDNVSLRCTTTEALNLATCKADTKTISYECIFDKEIDSSNVEIYAKIDDCYGTPFKVELQIFVDKLAESIYNNEEIEKSECIAEAKNGALLNLKNDYFNETGNVLLNSSYATTGRVVAETGDITTIINSFDTLLKDGKVVFSLKDCVRYISLKENSNPKIEFVTGKAKLVIDSFNILSSSEGMISDYQISINSAYTEVSGEPIIAPSVPKIDDPEIFFEDRITLVNNREFVLKANNESDNLDELFSDFDF